MLRGLLRHNLTQELEQGEEIVLFLRRHWMAMLPAFLAVGILALFPIFVLIMYSYFDISSLLLEWGIGVAPEKILAFFFAVYFLFLDFFFLVAWMQYYLDVTILTNRRLVDIEQINIFQRQVASTDLIYIQDVSSEVKGLLPSLLDYGRVIVQTAGERPNFILEDIPHPSAVARQILITAQGSAPNGRIPGEEIIKTHESQAFSVLKGQDTSTGVSSKKDHSASRSDSKTSTEASHKKQSREIGTSGEIDLS